MPWCHSQGLRAVLREPESRTELCTRDPSRWSTLPKPQGLYSVVVQAQQESGIDLTNSSTNIFKLVFRRTCHYAHNYDLAGPL